jgi:hypothetical protein
MEIKLETILRERIANRENARQLAEAYAAMVVEENTILRHGYSSINPVLPTQELPRIKRVAENETKSIVKRLKWVFSLRVLLVNRVKLPVIIRMDGKDSSLLLKRVDCLELGLLTKKNVRDFTLKLSDKQRLEILAWGINLSESDSGKIARLFFWMIVFLIAFNLRDAEISPTRKCIL